MWRKIKALVSNVRQEAVAKFPDEGWASCARKCKPEQCCSFFFNSTSRQILSFLWESLKSVFGFDRISIVNISDSFAFLLFQYSCFVQIWQIWTSLSLSPCQSEYWMKVLGWKKKSCPDWFWIIKKFGKSIAGPLGKMVKDGCPGSSRKWVKYHLADFSPYRGGGCGYLLTAPDVFRLKKEILGGKHYLGLGYAF